MTRALLEGSEAIARAALAAGCRFFAGYPMTPFTELLEHFAALLPEQGGACLLVCPDFCFEIYQYETPVSHEVSP